MTKILKFILLNFIFIFICKFSLFSNVYIYKSLNGKVYLTNSLKNKSTARYKEGFQKYKLILKGEDNIIVNAAAEPQNILTGKKGGNKKLVDLSKEESNDENEEEGENEEESDLNKKPKEKTAANKIVQLKKDTNQNKDIESDKETVPSDNELSASAEPINLNENKYDDIIDRYAKKFLVEYELIKSVIKAESDFREKAVSNKGAKGLMQIMDATFKNYSRLLNISNPDVFDPEHNIAVGTYYLAYLIGKYPTLEMALAAYNAGEKAVDEYQTVPPFDETKNFVANVMQLYDMNIKNFNPENEIKIKSINGKIFIYNNRYKKVNTTVQVEE